MVQCNMCKDCFHFSCIETTINKGKKWYCKEAREARKGGSYSRMLVRWPDGILLMVMVVIQTMDTQCDVKFSPSRNMRLLKADNWSKMMDGYAM